MIVAFDNTFLTLIINPNSQPRPNPETGLPVPHCKQRIEALVDFLSSGNHQLIIPAPCLAETLVRALDIQNVITVLKTYRVVEIAPFDAKSAVELAIISQKAAASGDKRNNSRLDWQQIKFDRQIVSIAKVNGASIFYTDDSAQASFAIEAGLSVKHTWD